MDDNNRVRPPIFSFDRHQWPRLLFLLVLMGVGVGMIIVGNLTAAPPPPDDSSARVAEQRDTGEGGLAGTAREMEGRLEEVLSEVQGAGRVTVRITLVSGPRYDYAINVSTNERQVREGSEANRTTEERTREDNLVLVQGGGGQQQPVVVEERQPQVQGVLVVADGAVKPEVQWALTRAVQTLLNVAPHQIEVLARQPPAS